MILKNHCSFTWNYQKPEPKPLMTKGKHTFETLLLLFIHNQKKFVCFLVLVLKEIINPDHGYVVFVHFCGKDILLFHIVHLQSAAVLGANLNIINPQEHPYVTCWKDSFTHKRWMYFIFLCPGVYKMPCCAILTVVWSVWGQVLALKEKGQLVWIESAKEGLCAKCVSPKLG